MHKYFEINQNGHNIRCKMYANDAGKIDRIIVFCHGFAGHKDNSNAEKFAGRVLSKNKNTAVLTFNLPCHGDDVKKKLTLSDCIEYLDIVLNYVRDTLHPTDIFSYAVSFGGYLVLRYISLHGNPFKKIALRSAAVNMYDILTSTIISADDLVKIQKGKHISVGFDRKIDVDAQFLGDLREADIREYGYFDYADDILMIHGTADEIVPFDAAAKFADDNVIEFISVPGADHRFMNPALMEIATKAIVRFFGIA